ncbi:MAG: glycosyltransferase [Prevotella sp.]|jgi:glycosyltransferase involved in cell wall biosynthesis|nr:glycosyltransferase [Prevotella sp.]
MKILLLGEYSNLHWTLGQGLRALGHDVTVASDGCRWRGNLRDVNLARKGYGILPTIKYIYDVYKNLDKLKGYDVVQLQNPIFLDFKAERNRLLYRFLKKRNKKIFMGAFGTDYYWIKTCLDRKTFRYSEYCIGDVPILSENTEIQINTWMGNPAKQALNREIAETCDGIVACLYEYYVSYLKDFESKLAYIPLPVNTDELLFTQRGTGPVIRFFIGIQTDRMLIKGADILYRALQELYKKYPNQCVIQKVESLPYQEYIEIMNRSDVLLDQLYSYTPAMNALAAMALGLIAVSGGEPESYEILNETELKPVINVLPSEEDVFTKLEQLVLHKDTLPALSLQSRQFVEKRHHYVKVAQQYLDFWNGK